MTTKRFFLFLSILLLFNNAKAQLKETFEKGIITTKEDTKIEGYIKNDELSHLSTELYFKLTENEKNCIKYTTSQIKSFQTYTGDTFDLLTVKINNNKTEISVFGNLLLKGETSLYKFVYNSTTFYVVAKKDKNHVLQDDEFLTSDNQITRYHYQGVLNVATEGLLTEKYTKITFDEKFFIKIITEYNASKGKETIEVTHDKKHTHYTIINIGGGLNSSEYEYFIQAMYRLYYPKISRSTSINLGLNYYNLSSTNSSINNGFNESLISLPLQFQQNILNKNIRPYFFGGVNLYYLNIVDANNNSLIGNGLQKNFGFGLLYGVGIEIDIRNSIMIKSEFRHERFNHLILFGIGYNFSK